ncbi:ABC transporter permease [Chania multitudinisentens]|uniref:ABC transporter permease n=1 Tax=Chania multitudinisentens TaxID=1639108 RepID=UPI00197FB3CC|nr:FtsX-like permease family protein [Chania multitudinisentens]
MRNRRRALLTISVNAIATMALLVSIGFGLFTYESLEEMAIRENGNVILSMPGYFSTEEDFPLQLGMSDYQALQHRYLSDPDTKSVLPRVDFSGLISNGEKSTIFIGQGVEAREFQIKGPIMLLTHGKTLSGKSDPALAPEVMLAEGLAKNLKVSVGDEITLMSTTVNNTLNAIDFRVVGIFSTGVPELDKRQLYTSLSAAQQLLDSDKVSTLSIFLYEHRETEAKLKQIQIEQTALEATPWINLASFYQKVKNLYNNLFSLLGGIIIVMVFLAISNTMSMSVVERTKEIGTLAALGSFRCEIIRNFVLEGLLLGLVGTFIGTLLALSVSGFLLVVNIEMPPPPGSSMAYPLYVNFSLIGALVTSLILTGICIMAAWLAARKGARKTIVEALNHV